MATLQIRNKNFDIDEITLVQQSIYVTEFNNYWSTDFELPASTDLYSVFGWENILCADFTVEVEGVLFMGANQYDCKIKALSISERKVQLSLTANKFERTLSRPICDVEFDWEQQDPENRHDDWFTLNDTMSIGELVRPKQRDEYIMDAQNIRLLNVGYASSNNPVTNRQFFPSMNLGSFVCRQLERHGYTYDTQLYYVLEAYNITVDKLRVTKNNPYWFIDYNTHNDTEDHSCRYADSAFFDNITWFDKHEGSYFYKGCELTCNTSSTWSYWIKFYHERLTISSVVLAIYDITDNSYVLTVINHTSDPATEIDESVINFIAGHRYRIFYADKDDTSIRFHNIFNMKLKELAPGATYDTANDHDIDFANNNYNWEDINRGIFGFFGCFDCSLQQVLRDIEIVLGISFDIERFSRHVSHKVINTPVPIEGWVDSYEFGSDLFANKSYVEDSVGNKILVKQIDTEYTFDLGYLDEEKTILKTNCRIPNFTYNVTYLGNPVTDVLGNKTFRVRSGKNPKIYLPYLATDEEKNQGISDYKYGNYFFSKLNSQLPLWLTPVYISLANILPGFNKKLITAKIYTYDNYNEDRLIHFEGRDWLVNEAEIDNNGLVLLTCTLN